MRPDRPSSHSMLLSAHAMALQQLRKVGRGASHLLLDSSLWHRACSAPPWSASSARRLPSAARERERLWASLFAEPAQWLDCRAAKLAGAVKDNHPDFKCGRTSSALWLSRGGAPSWAEERLRSDAPQWAVYSPDPSARWERLFAEPKEWLDFRAAKVAGRLNEKFPDFKHRSSMEPLWLRSAPTWVPEKIDKEAAPPWEQSSDAQSEAAWESLFSDAEQWFDCRSAKAAGEVRPTFPDFSRKRDRHGLWLTGQGVPSWLPDKLGFAAPKWAEFTRRPGVSAEHLWESLFREPGQWRDCRPEKRDNRLRANHPDFTRGDDALWVVSATTPQWAADRLREADRRPLEHPATSWTSLFDEPQDWSDCRPAKAAGAVAAKHPDFKHRAGAALWLNGAPAWVAGRLAGGPAWPLWAGAAEASS